MEFDNVMLMEEKMKAKDNKSGIFNYIDYLFFISVLMLSIFELFRNRFIGTVGVVLSVFIIAAYTYKKKIEKKEWIDRLHNVEFDVDNIIKKAVKNNPLPICILELDGTIFWSNNAFDEMVSSDEESSISKNIEDFIEDFTIRKVLDEKKILEDEVVFKERDYVIRYCFSKTMDESTGSVDYRVLIYWIDRTDYINMKNKFENGKEAIMFIEIDGYEDVIKSTPEENRSLMAMDIDKLLTNLESESNGLLQKLSNDKYIIFMKKEHLESLERSKFSILDKAREINHGNSLPVTLSIGVGVDGESVEQTGEFASGAFDMVLGRGGDQVALRNQEGFNFYGGKSKGFERKTKVKSRLIGFALRELINQSETILIMGHHYPDMDAIGAAVGVYDICKSYGKQAHIVLDSVNEAVEIFVDRIKDDAYYSGMFVGHEKAIDICNKNTLVVVVDTHRPSYTECEELLNISKRVVVIDHHRRGVEYIQDTVLLFHEIYVSSTCEMVTELIQYTEHDIKINKLTAEGLLGGIYLDTKNFEFKTGVRTFEAASFLRNMGADTLSVKKFFNSYAEDFLVKAEIIQRTEILDEKICISYSKEEIDNINIVIAKAADELLNIKKIEASFVLGMKGDTVFISARSLGDINVHVLMEKIGGGGHIDIAGAQMKDVSLSQAYNMVKDIIEDYLKEE